MTGQAPPSDLQLDNALWQMATALWGAPGFEEACLQAQDEGISVTHLLVALYSAERGKLWSGTEPPALMSWREQMTEPLRALRQKLSKDNEAVQTLREQIKSAELSSERVELGWWSHLVEQDNASADWRPSALDSADLASRNLGAVGLGDSHRVLHERLLQLWHQHRKGVTFPNHKQNGKRL